ncbi:hypothetical protein ACXYTJ_17210 [Gilvimarinus sp. F26214L]|uniref:hypothetical protein n=1 Tax=Gilvimarinus sp. DZF01 TaxID=3461371 RepID=UPI0040467AE4
MKNPVRLILKKVRTDVHGQLIDAGYKTVDIDHEGLETLLFEASPHTRGKFEVVGAELLNESKLLEEYEKERENF